MKAVLNLAPFYDYGEEEMEEEPWPWAIQEPPDTVINLELPAYYSDQTTHTCVYNKIGYDYILPQIQDDFSDTEIEEIFGTSKEEDEEEGQVFPPCWLYQKNFANDRLAKEGYFSKLTPPKVNLQLRRRMPKDLDLSGAVFLIGQTTLFYRVFIFNSVDGSLYHVCRLRAKEFQYPFFGTTGYAAIDGKLYFAGGCFQLPQQEYNLEVECFNLKTQCSEHSLSKLNDPKPIPTVFVYNKKIYVIANPSALPDLPPPGSTMIECLDPREGTWTKLPNPPFSRNIFCPYLLDTCKGILLVAVDASTEEKEEDAFELYKFNLTSSKWRFHSLLSKNFEHVFCDHPLLSSSLMPDYGVEALARHTSYYGTPAYFFAGSTVENFLFCFDTGKRVPLIVVYDMSSQGVPDAVNCTVNLSDGLKDFVHHDLSNGYLNHLGGHKFCLVIFYTRVTKPVTKAVCILTFELQRTSATQSEATAHQPKQPRAEKSSFSLGSHECRAFHLPMDVQFSFCKKME